MSQVVGGAAGRLQLALVMFLGGSGVSVILTLLTTAPGTPSTLVLGAVAAAIAAAVASSRRPVTLASPPLGFPLQNSDGGSALRRGRVTDVPRHPLRPRAPGLV